MLAVVAVGALGVGLAMGYWGGRGGSSNAHLATVDCASGGSLPAILKVKGKALLPETMSFDKKLAYIELLRDFTTRRYSVMEEYALKTLAGEKGATEVVEPNEEQVVALYEANQKAFPATMKREDVLANLRQMLRSQQKYRVEAERRAKAMQDGSLTYVSASACGPAMPEVRALPGVDAAKVVLGGSFFCPECRGNFGHVDRWIESETKAGRKVAVGHLAVVAGMDTADAVFARAEICVQKDMADKAQAFWRAAHRLPTSAGASVEAAKEALTQVVKDAALDEAKLSACMDSEAVTGMVQKRVDLFKDLNPLSASFMLHNDRPVVLRRDRPEEIPTVIGALLK
jgi:hypothetical protein